MVVNIFVFLLWAPGPGSLPLWNASPQWQLLCSAHLAWLDWWVHFCWIHFQLFVFCLHLFWFWELFPLNCILSFHLNKTNIGHTSDTAAIHDCQPVTNCISSIYFLAIHDYGLELIKKYIFSVSENCVEKVQFLDPRGVLSSNQLITGNPKTHAKVSWALKVSQSCSVGKTMTRDTAAWTLVKIIVRQSWLKNIKAIHRTTAEVRIDIRCFLPGWGQKVLDCCSVHCKSFFVTGK